MEPLRQNSAPGLFGQGANRANAVGADIDAGRKSSKLAFVGRQNGVVLPFIQQVHVLRNQGQRIGIDNDGYWLRKTSRTSAAARSSVPIPGPKAHDSTCPASLG